MKVSLATEMAPPFVLVAHFFIAGIVFLVLSGVWLFGMTYEILGYFISFSWAAFSHLYLLGFVMMIIFGAMYQLLPVVLEAPIFSKDFAYIQFYAYLVGLVMMVLGFSVDGLSPLIAYGAVILYTSMLIFCSNVFLTFYRLETMSLVGNFLLVATVFLFLSVSLGLLIGLNLSHGFLEIDMDAWTKAHIIGTLGGFVMMVIMGVSMVLIPMFSLSHGFKDTFIKAAFYLYSMGIFGCMTALIFALSSWLLMFSALLGLIGVVCYLNQMRIIFSQRVRKQNDYWVKNIVLAWGHLILSSLSLIMYVVSGKSQWAMLLGVIFFFGFLLPFVVGHIYKIFPFLIWYQKFSPLVGKQKVPLLHEMIQSTVANTQTYMLFGAVFIQVCGIYFEQQVLFLGGSILLWCSLLLVAYNAFFAFNFKIKE